VDRSPPGITNAAASKKHEDSDDSRPSCTSPKNLHFQFYRNPVEILVDPVTGKAAGLKVERTELRHVGAGKQQEGEMAVVAVGTGRSYEWVM
jgi:hypothetical protein